MATQKEIDIASLRQDYAQAALHRNDVDSDPFNQFAIWFEAAHQGGILEPNALILATVDGSGQPSTRTLLLKGVDDRGFTFFTNYASNKGRDLETNPKASATFLWLPMERQVHVLGTVEKVTAEESDAYFSVRPYMSQIGAVASQQSRPISDRGELEEKFAELREEYPEGATIPRPASWGGYRLIPHTIEFWQGRRSRLHDRLVYAKTADGWKIDRLSP